jgi:hypothetical protein
MLFAPVYEPVVLAELKAGYVAALARFEPRLMKQKGKDQEIKLLTYRRKTIQDSQQLSKTCSQLRKSVPDGSFNS